jgi:hypothetical protein
MTGIEAPDWAISALFEVAKQVSQPGQVPSSGF